MTWGPARGLSQAARFLKRAGVPHYSRRQILESFQPDCSVEIIADDLVVFRYYCSTTAARGRWLAARLLTDPLEELALPPGNTAEHIATWIIPKGTVV